MSKNKKKAKESKLMEHYKKSYGLKSARPASQRVKLNVIPTGILALDYALGTGGWPKGHFVGVYGIRDIGKSSIIGLSAIRECQRQGQHALLIAVEPHVDSDWLEKHGVDLDMLYIAQPESAEEAEQMFLDGIRFSEEEDIGLIVFDSIGALALESEMKEGGKNKAYGSSGLVSHMVRVGAPLAARRNVCCILLNQVREKSNPKGLLIYKQPGGNALEHCETIIVHLKGGGTAITIQEHGESVEVGRPINALIERNKTSEGSRKKASFTFYSQEVEGLPFGLDVAEDVINTGKRLGIIDGSTWLTLPDGTKHNGKKKVAEYLAENPGKVDEIRDLVIDKLLNPEEGVEVEDVA